MRQEIESIRLGQASKLPVPVPFRNFVAQSRLGVPREEHEAFFRHMLSDVTEPTLPFGLTDVHADGSQLAGAQRALDSLLARRTRERARSLGVCSLVQKERIGEDLVEAVRNAISTAAG